MSMYLFPYIINTKFASVPVPNFAQTVLVYVQIVASPTLIHTSQPSKVNESC